MITYIGSENIISPLGNSAQENFSKVKKGLSGIELFKSVGVGKEDLHLSKIKNLDIDNKFDYLLSSCLSAIVNEASSGIINSEETIVLISTTKGDIEENLTGYTTIDIYF